MNSTTRANTTSPTNGEGDQTLNCRDCKQPFVFTVGEQGFYAEKGFSIPARCKPCRDIRKAQRDGGQAADVSQTAAAQPMQDESGRTGGRVQGKGGKRRRDNRGWGGED